MSLFIIFSKSFFTEALGYGLGKGLFSIVNARGVLPSFLSPEHKHKNSEQYYQALNTLTNLINIPTRLNLKFLVT